MGEHLSRDKKKCFGYGYLILWSLLLVSMSCFQWLQISLNFLVRLFFVQSVCGRPLVVDIAAVLIDMTTKD